MIKKTSTILNIIRYIVKKKNLKVVVLLYNYRYNTRSLYI